MRKRQPYTMSQMPSQLRDVAAIFADSQVILYTVCVHHVDEVIKNETEALADVEMWSGHDLLRWLVFPTPRGERFCNVCIQLIEGDRDRVRPQPRKALRGVEVPKQKARAQ